jgi:hypothetical protein
VIESRPPDMVGGFRRFQQDKITLMGVNNEMINMASGFEGADASFSFFDRALLQGFFVLWNNCKSIRIVYDCKISGSIFRYL